MGQEFNTSRSPAITDEERKLIDEAIAEGRTTKVPQGVTAIDWAHLDSRKEIIEKMYRIRKRKFKFLRAARKKQET